MKKICLSILLALSVTHISTAQIGNLKNKLKIPTKEKTATVEISDDDFWKISPKSQQELAKSFFERFRNEKWYRYEFVNGTSTTTKSSEKFFFQNIVEENGNIKSFQVMACPYRYDFTPNNSVGSFYALERDIDKYNSSKKHPEYIVMFGDNFFIYASSILQNQGTKEVSVYEYSNLNIVTTDAYASKLNALKSEKDMAVLLKKLSTTYNQLYRNAEKALNTDVANKEQENRSKFSIKDKKVKSISAKFAQTSYKPGDAVSFEIIATLEDGSSISTTKGGYLDDYEITYSGFSRKEGRTGEGRAFVTYMVDTDKLIPNDKIGMTVKSKYHPTLKSEASASADYDTEWTFAREGVATTKKAASGADIRLEVKKVKVNGKDCYEMKVYYWGKLEDHVRQYKPMVTISVSGLDGTNPKGQDGGDGGNVEIIKDPSAADFKVLVYNTGGKGSDVFQNHGRNGNKTELTQKLSW